MAELPFNSDAHNRIAVPSEEPSSLLASRHLKWGSLTNLDGHSWCHAETSEPCEEETGSEARGFQTGMLKYNIYTTSFLGKYLFLLGSSSFMKMAAPAALWLVFSLRFLMEQDYS